MARLPTPLRPLWPQAKKAYTWWTGAASPVTRQVARVRGGWLPRTSVPTVDEVTHSSCSKVHHVVPSLDLERATPIGMPASHWVFREALAVRTPRVVIAELPHGRVLGPHGAVVTADGSLVAELSPYWSIRKPSQHPLYLHPFRVSPTDVAGRLGLVAGVGDFNYCHFLFDIFPRATLFADCPTLEQPDRFYLPLGLSFQRELAAKLGLGGDDIVDSSVHTHVCADVLVAPSHADFDLEAPSWTVEILRDRLLPTGAGLVPGRRIYVPRAGKRNNRVVRNEPEVRAELLRRGFTIVDPGKMTVEEQIVNFAQAEVVVAAHGAALANLTFASPGATVVEIFAPDYVKPCYWALSQRVPGLNYRYLVGEGTPRVSRERAMKGVASDITVNVATLALLLDGGGSLGAPSAGPSPMVEPSVL